MLDLRVCSRLLLRRLQLLRLLLLLLLSVATVPPAVLLHMLPSSPQPPFPHLRLSLSATADSVIPGSSISVFVRMS
jgi:hypothetical protein